MSQLQSILDEINIACGTDFSAPMDSEMVQIVATYIRSFGRADLADKLKGLIR